MDPGDADAGCRSLSDSYAALWNDADAGLPPDVFAFLTAHPGASRPEVLEVLGIDQRLRWRTGQSLAVADYLRALPALADSPEVIDALAQSEHRARLEFAASRETQSGDVAGKTEAISGVSLSFSLHWPDDPVGITTVEAGLAAPPPLLPRTDPGPGPAVRFFDPPIAWATEIIPTFQPGPRFTIQRKLGAGGMGIVYEALDHQLGETVALKTMRRVDPLALYRFKNEFRTLSDLSHPNLVNLYELFAFGDTWFFTMELIDGIDFISHTRTGPRGENFVKPAKEPADRRFLRLRKAFAQLAEGVVALHDAGKLHRDIKPTNVLVTQAERVVLLDFGLSTDLGREGAHRSENAVLLGTAAYMAPEQGTQTDVGKAFDWYSVGVMLYEALTGRVPFQGTLLDIVSAKRSIDPRPPGAIADDIPQDLDALCSELLNRDPAGRPSGRDILARLTSAAPGITPFGVPAPFTSQAVLLIGRAPHLRMLEGAFACVRQGEPQTFAIFGRSGTGKTTLLQSFLDDVADSDDTVVLSGRCYERESMPYKALDSVVDALSRYLNAIDHDEVMELLPADASLLARIFPALQRVDAIAEAPRSPNVAADPQEFRHRAFLALRELLARLSARKLVVIAIDDLQWADAEDGLLLEDLLRPPGAPVVLFLGCFQGDHAESSPIVRSLLGPPGKRGAAVGRHELVVEVLSLAESRELALALLGHEHASARAEAHLIARESRGNPFFISALVRYVQKVGRLAERTPRAGEVLLDAVLWAQVEQLPEDARRLLEILAVAGRPIGQTEASRAAGLGADRRAHAVAALRGARLIRSGGSAYREGFEPYHDRIRETVRMHLSPERIAEHHDALARALEQTGRADPEILAYHFRGGGRLEDARRYYALAANRAAEGLAFAHAARLYRAALECPGSDKERTKRLNASLGDALANAGQGGEAARAYLAAASEAAMAESFELRRQAALQFLISGHVDDGLAVLREVLQGLGMARSETPRRALCSLLLHRVKLRVRGIDFLTVGPGEIPKSLLARIDLCWSAVTGLSLIDPIRAADFQVRGLLLALRAGEPYRIARALAMEAAHEATAGVAAHRRALRYLDAAEALVEKSERDGQPECDEPDPAEINTPSYGIRLTDGSERSLAHVRPAQARGVIGIARAVVALMLGEWRSALREADAAAEIVRGQCAGVSWELDSLGTVSLQATARMGNLVELRQRLTTLLEETERRGDLRATTTLIANHRAILHLCDDDPAAASHDLAAVMADWSRRGFHIQHSAAFRSRVQILLYQGAATAAWETIQTHWPAYQRSLLFRIQTVRIQFLELRASAALAVAGTIGDAEPLLRSAARDAKHLEREMRPWSLAHAARIRGTLAAIRQDDATAETLLDEAARRYQEADMALHRAAARRQLGTLVGGTRGQDIVEEADAAMAQQQVRNPARLAAMLAPGFSARAKMAATLESVRETPTFRD